MKLNDLFESKEKNLLGLEISGKLITDNTKHEMWDKDFSAGGKHLTSLEHCPTAVGGNFSCRGNQLTSLEHAPTSVNGYFSCDSNQLTSLKDVHKHVKQISGGFYAETNPIKSHVLGLLLIKGCTEIMLDNKKVQMRLNKYLPNTRGHAAVAECQDELIEADLDEYAQI